MPSRACKRKSDPWMERELGEPLPWPPDDIIQEMLARRAVSRVRSLKRRLSSDSTSVVRASGERAFTGTLLAFPAPAFADHAVWRSRAARQELPIPG